MRSLERTCTPILSFPAASPDQMHRWLSRHYSRTRKMSCSSCRRKATVASITFWYNPFNNTPMPILNFWTTAGLLLDRRTTLYGRIHLPQNPSKISCTTKKFPRHQIQRATSTLTIPTASLRSCQTITMKPPATNIRTCFTKTIMV